MKKWHVFFISWVTWAGKWTLIKWLLKENIKNLYFAKSVKTRDFRPWEKDGIDYIKMSVSEFEKAIKNWEFLEYNFVHKQNYYGTRKKDLIENGINKWKNIIKEVDMLILPKLMETIKDLREYFSFIFLDLPEDEIKNRMLARWDKVWDENYKFRVESAIKEKKLAYLCDYIIEATKSPEEVLKEVQNIIKEKVEN